LSATTPQSADAALSKEIMLGIAYARLGHKHKAARQLKIAEKSPHSGFKLAYHLAALSVALGDNDKAFNYLESAFVNRQTSILFVNVDPLMDPLRGDPRFDRLVERLHIH
jgi:hypothetical protein